MQSDQKQPSQHAVKVTLHIEPDDKIWGFSEMIGMMKESTLEERIECVIQLANEDIGAFLEDARWEVDFV